jgi:hypothetical protein
MSHQLRLVSFLMLAAACGLPDPSPSPGTYVDAAPRDTVDPPDPPDASGDAPAPTGRPLLVVDGSDLAIIADVPIGQISRQVRFAIRNDGTVASNPLVYSDSGLGDGFLLEDNTCAARPLAPGARCEVAYRFRPVVAGDRSLGGDLHDPADPTAINVGWAVLATGVAP